MATRWEAKSGSYLRWLTGVRDRFSAEEWEILCDLRAPLADAYLRARGIVPWEDSTEHLLRAMAILQGLVPRGDEMVLVELAPDRGEGES